MYGSYITDPERASMKVYAARTYKDDEYRNSNYVKVNLPEYLPTTPQNDASTDLVIPADYVANDYPDNQSVLKLNHFLELPLLRGTRCPVRFDKGAQFMLVYPTGKVEDGKLVYIDDAEDFDDRGHKTN